METLAGHKTLTADDADIRALDLGGAGEITRCRLRRPARIDFYLQ